MNKKAMIVLFLASVFAGIYIGENRVKRLQRKYRKADDTKKRMMYFAEMEKTILKAKEKDEETKKYAVLGEKLVNLDPETSEKQLNDTLTKFMEENKIPCPFGDWSFESFDKFMSDPNNKLTFN